jgi:signal transduction histidine kinase/CheY-like chemotaxis protein/ligand-binding sensor domain-containing protein
MRVELRYLIFAFLIILSPARIFCQKILVPEINPPDARWDNFLVKGGEAMQISESVFIDSKGFLWTGTDNGLYRFDGTRYQEYNVSNTDSNGLAGYVVTSIFEDSDGMIWVGTSEALNLLDRETGSFIHLYPDSTRKNRICNSIRTIREDSDGLIWILTREDIYSYDRKEKTFHRYKVDSLSWVPENIYFPGEQFFTEDKSGNKWFVTFKGLYRYRKKDRTFRMVIPDKGINELKGINSVKCVVTDKTGSVWIGTDNGGLFRWNEPLNEPEKIDICPPGYNKNLYNGVTAILPDNNGTIWCFGNGVFTKYDPESNISKLFIFHYKERPVPGSEGPDMWINDVFQDTEGKIWFLNYVGGFMFRFDPVTEALSIYRVPKPSVFQCIMDKDGTFWFACVMNNIYRLLTHPVKYYTISNVNNSSHVASIHRGSFIEDDQNRVWFLFNRGIYTIDNFDLNRAVRLKRFIFPDGDTIAGGGFRDSKGNLWFGNKNGKVARFNPVTREIISLNMETPSEKNDVVFVPLIREDTNGRIWIAAGNDLLLFNESRGRIDNLLSLNDRKDDKDTKFIEDFFIDSYGVFWILNVKSLLSVKMPEMKVKNYSGYLKGIFDVPLSNIRVVEDLHRNLYFLNYMSGVYYFDREKDIFSRVEIGLPRTGTVYYDMLYDRSNRLWVCHDKGVTIYDPLNGEIRLVKVPRLQFDIQSVQLKSGHVIIMSENNLYVFNEKVPRNNIIPPIFITGILVNGEDYNTLFIKKTDITSLSSLDLPFRHNTFTFEFAALNYIEAEQNRYRYFLSGFDKDTTDAIQGESAEYKNLSPGKYRFWVTGSNNDGLWNPEGAILDIRIRPPWYESVMAFVIYSFVFIFALTAYIRIRTIRLTRDKVRLQKEIAMATEELENKNRQLEEVDRIKTDFFTDISHEIRTPLSLIMGPLENLSKEEMLSSRISAMVDLMKRNAQRLMVLVNQLLDISKLDAGKMKITLEENDLLKCLKILVYEFLSLAESKKIKYIVDIPDNALITLFDRNKIEKIIFNLLSNAFKYTPHNGTVKCDIRIRERSTNGKTSELIIKVIDTGPGITKDQQARIFERFYRVEGHHEADGHGTGIGLSLVQEFVSLLKGDINLNSEPGKGSEFTVILPLGKDHLSEDEYIISHVPDELFKEPGDITRQKNIARFFREPDVGKMKILVVEDNEDLRTFIAETMKEMYHILEASDGKTGINIAYTSIPDLIISDIMMPDTDGLSLCRQLKNDERTSHIPIIILTARATQEDKITGLKSGADDYVIKPFNIEELKTRISNLLSMRDKLKLKYNRFFPRNMTEEQSLTVDDKFMIKVLEIINSNYRDYSFDVGHLIEQTGMSRTHLTRKLKVLTGLTPACLIHNIRMEKAAEMLRNKSGNITEISYSIGLSNPSYFTKAFRKHFGVSPKNYFKN